MEIDPRDFEAFELEQSLFDVVVDGVPVWERIRHRVYRAIRQQNGFGKAHGGGEKGATQYIRSLSLFLRNTVIKNPFLASEHDFVFLHNSRRKLRDDGYWWDIHNDPIHEACDLDYVHLEAPYKLEHRQPARTDNLRYTDLIKFWGEIQQRIGVGAPTIDETDANSLESANEAIRERFDADVDLLGRVRSELHLRAARLGLYRQLLNRIDPEVLVLICSYGKETLIEACQERGTTVVELQHGTIYDSHFGYSYRPPRTKTYFPDYLLTFGDFWNDVAEYPIPDERIITVGYPYLEESIEKYDHVETTEQVLFISQGSIGGQLSKFAVEVSEHPAFDRKIRYKLHPGEYDRWQSEYPWLVDANVDVIEDPDIQLYQLFAESIAQVGVYSTAVYEGLCFDLETYLYDCSGFDAVQPLIDKGTATLVSSPEELIKALGRRRTGFNRGDFFAADSKRRICEVIDSIAANQ